MEDANPDFDESQAVLYMHIPMDAVLEKTFTAISVRVRNEIDELHNQGDGHSRENYGVDLLREIERLRNAGEMDDSTFEYCRLAAREILNMELIYFQNEFDTMH